jgi:hypothetical protein
LRSAINAAVGRLGGEVEQFGHRDLHPVGELEGVDAGLDLGILHDPQPQPVELGDGVDDVATSGMVDAGRIGEKQDRVALGLELHPLAAGRQIKRIGRSTALPKPFPGR